MDRMAACLTLALRVMISSPNPIVGAGLRQMLAGAPDVVSISEVRQISTASDVLMQQSIDLVLLEGTSAYSIAVDIATLAAAARPAVPVLVMTSLSDLPAVRRTFRHLARGYVAKESSHDELLDAVRLVGAGANFVDPVLVDACFFEQKHRLTEEIHLSPREYEVLGQFATGRSVSEIARYFGLSVKTVSAHKMRLMQKLGIATNTELIRYALSAGCIAP